MPSSGHWPRAWKDLGCTLFPQRALEQIHNHVCNIHPTQSSMCTLGGQNQYCNSTIYFLLASRLLLKGYCRGTKKQGSKLIPWAKGDQYGFVESAGPRKRLYVTYNPADFTLRGVTLKHCSHAETRGINGNFPNSQISISQVQNAWFFTSSSSVVTSPFTLKMVKYTSPTASAPNPD